MTINSIRRAPIVVAVITLAVSILAPSANAAEDRGRYIVVLENSVQNLSSVARAQTEPRDGSLGFVYRHSIKGYSAVLPDAAVKGLRNDPRVKYVTPDHPLHLLAQTTPTGIERIFASENVSLDIDEENDEPVDVDVAVIDTGIGPHPDLNVVERTDCSIPEEGKFTCKDGEGSDTSGHGSHVGGIVGAIDNGEGVVGVAPGARLWSVKVFLKSPIPAFESSAVAGVDWVAAHADEIEVANMSFGCHEDFLSECGPLVALDSAIAKGVEKGVVFVAAAGNEKADAGKMHPGSSPDVITVSAIADYDGEPGGNASPTCNKNFSPDDTLLVSATGGGSNFGEAVEVAAPGTCIYSAWLNGGYAEISGTSMAAPHVAGAAAILAVTSNPEDKADVEAIRSTIVAEGNFNWTDTSGDGIQEPLLDVSNEAVFDLGEAPAATTGAATAAGSTATLTGDVNPSKLKTTYYFEYGTTPEYGEQVPASPEEAGSGTENIEVSEEISGLASSTLYHYRLVAVNDKGTTYGEDRTFTIDVATDSASAVQPGLATLNGMVNPAGAVTTYKFEYGKTASYGASAPIPSGSAGSGTSMVPVSQEIKELEPETVYHYRLTATKSGGTVYGEDRVFRSSTPPYQFKSSFGAAQVDRPFGLDVDSEGNVLVADYNHSRIQKYNSKGEHLATFGASGSGKGELAGPADIAVLANGDFWVTDSGNDRVQKFNSKGEHLATFGSSGTGDGQFSEPWGIDTASNGDIWVVGANQRVQKFTASGTFIKKVTGFEGPRGLEVDANDHVWVTEWIANRVQELSPSGEKLSQFGEAGSENGEFDEPWAVDVKPSGDLLVTDRWNDRVQQFTPGGEFNAQFGNGTIIEPGGIADTGEGIVYVSNTWQDRVEKWQQAIPRAVTGTSWEISATGATITGVVNPRGVATAHRFEYGKTTAYGTKTSNEGAGAGTADLPIIKQIKFLEPNTTYHYRIVATSSEGTIYGQDRTFTTKTTSPATLNAMAVTEPFNGSTSPVSDFWVDWSALGWVANKGANLANGWQPGSHPNVNGAFYGSTVTDTGPGIAAAVTMAVNPGPGAERYFSLWLDMPTPSGAKAGYELRFTSLEASNTYKVTLSKWQAGSQTVLATKSSYSFVNGNSLALMDEGATVSAWTNTGSGFSQLLSASDATFASGNAGVEGSGSSARLTNFKVGSTLASVVKMNAALNELALKDSFATDEVPLAGGGAWATLAWDDCTVPSHNMGQVLGGWGPFDAYPNINGVYWTKATVPDTGAGVAVAATLLAGPANTSRYFSLWLDMPSPASARTGYELRFTETATNVYEVALSKWQAGSKTVLASKSSYSFPVNSQFALVDKGATVSVWTKTGSEYTQLISASDSTFKTGYTGIEGSGNITRLKDFRSGPLSPF